MTVFVETSFLLSLATQDANSGAARKWWKANPDPIITSALVLFECVNALRNLKLRGLLTEEDAAEANLTLERLVIERLVVVRDIRLRLLMPESRRLIDHFAAPVSQGGMDVLHVAAARVLRMKTLLSFDENQCDLALSAELQTAP